MKKLGSTGRCVARIWKRGGFLKEWENCKQPWPEFSLFIRKLRRIFRPKSENQTLFQPKNRWSPKKKVFTEIETEFLAKITNSNTFSPNNRWFPKKNKKTKGLHQNWDGVFGQNHKFKHFFGPKTGDFQKKRSSPKLERIFRPKSEIHTFFKAESRHLLHNFGTQFPLEGLFSFFHQNRPQKNQKRAILHTLQANGGGSSPPAPPGYATEHWPTVLL